MRTRTLIITALLAVPHAGLTQLSVREQESPDHSSWWAEIHVDTIDRGLVPLTMERRTTQPDARTTRTETVTRTRLSDGSYFESQRETAVTEKDGPNLTRTTSQTVAMDREHRARATGEVRATTTRTGTGQKTDETVFKRNSSGQLVPERETESTTVKNSDGSRSTQRVENKRDVNGNAVLERSVQETTRVLSPTEKVVTELIRGPNHRPGQLATTAQEVTTIRTEGKTIRSERVISEPRGTGWEARSKIVSTETQAPDGSIQRDTIRYALPHYSESQPTPLEPLEPKLKLVERLVNKPDGTQVLEREVLVRDTNGQWNPSRFSTGYETQLGDKH